MEITSVSLKDYSSLRIGGEGRVCFVTTPEGIREAYLYAKENNLIAHILGDGTNTYFGADLSRFLFVKMNIKGVEFKDEGDTVLVTARGGEVWDEVVQKSAEQNLWGIENLSHIPGSTGAIAVQNVGAYGQEASSVIKAVTVFNRESRVITSLNNEDCKFAYRSSIFNTIEKGKYIIFDILLELKKAGSPNLSYRDLKAWFGDKQPTLTDLRAAVIQIRDKKFPFPTEAKKGNAGSFFKNPVLNKIGYEKCKTVILANFGSKEAELLENKRFYEGSEVKIPAAFLMEICNVKSTTFGGAAINANQPLVIINETGLATAQDVFNLASSVKERILAKTGIELIFEPELVGF